ncbi:MAG: pimeloyl-ACP methyl ester esterase BioH [Wenzhouxiangella sp.]
MTLVTQQLGHGPRLTLIHGWAMHSGLFNGLAHELARFAQVDCLDLPGHGQARDEDWPASTDPLLASLARQSQGGWLLGWSLGGLLALMTARQHPESVAGVIMVAATPCFAQRPHWPHGVAEPLVAQLAHELAVGPEQVLNRFLALEVHGSQNAARDLRLLREEAFRHGLPRADALKAGLDLLRQTDLSQALGEIETPVLLIGGRRDRLVPFEALSATAERLANSELVQIPGAAHAPFLTSPDAVASAIQTWLEPQVGRS